MADVITRFKVETTEYDRKIGQSKTKLKEFEKSGADASKALNDFAGKMGVSIPKLGAMGVAIGATTAALKVAKDALSQSESAIDEWGRMTSGAKGAYDMFLQSLNTGNWDNFFTRLNDAITGARDLYDALDRLGSIKANNQAAIAITQQSIQQLRLRQQNGEDVTSELTAATERLAKLQRQEVEAGITAGTDQMVQTLKNAGISEAMARQAADEIARGGQDVFDKYAQMVKDLEKEGTGKGKAVSKLGGIIKYYQEGTFDEANLNEEQKKMYQLAKAITERETTLQEGISTYAQAVQQGTASAREQFKNTKYGSSGNGGGGTKSVSGFTSDQIEQLISEANEATNIFGEMTTSGVQLRDVWAEIMEAPSEWIDEPIDNLKTLQKYMDDYKSNIEDTAKANQYAAQTFGMVAGAIAGIDNPAAKILGTLGQAIAQVALAYSETLAKDKSSKSNIWSFIAASTAATISMVSTIASIKSNARFADGGIVPGNRFSGDQTPILANAGEVVLNKAQQSAIANQLQQGSSQAQTAQPYVNAEMIYLGLSNYLKRSGRGEIVTTH